MERTPEFLALYPDGYGRAYAKQSPDYNRCCARVYSDAHRASYQCKRKNGHGLHGAYCKIHDPEKVAARREAQLSAWQINWSKERRRADFVVECQAAIRLIADGHNDPRALAQSIIDKLEGKP